MNIAPLDCQIAVSLNLAEGKHSGALLFPRAGSEAMLIVSPFTTITVYQIFYTQERGFAGVVLTQCLVGSCTVSIESAGPPLSEYLQPSSGSLGRANYFSISPDKLRGAAGYIIQKCAQESGGIGGYVTLYFAAAGEVAGKSRRQYQ